MHFSSSNKTIQNPFDHNCELFETFDWYFIQVNLMFIIGVTPILR